MQVYYTPESLADLQNVKKSVIETFFDEKLAEDVLKTITKSIRNLEIFPYMGTEVRLSNGVVTEYRYLFIKHNYAFYRVEMEQVRVVRVLHERQDYMRILFGITEE